MVYLLAPHSSALQTSTTKFRQDFIGPLFIDTILDKTHYRLKDTTGLLLDSMYRMSCIKKGSACTPQGIVNTFDDYEKALKNTLLNKLAIESPDNKFVDVHKKMVQNVLLTVLVLLWTMPLFMARCNIKAKYVTKQKVNYREEDEIIKKPLSCTELVCNEYQTDKDGTIDLSRSKRDIGIQYRHQKKDEAK